MQVCTPDGGHGISSRLFFGYHPSMGKAVKAVAQPLQARFFTSSHSRDRQANLAIRKQPVEVRKTCRAKPIHHAAYPDKTTRNSLSSRQWGSIRRLDRLQAAQFDERAKEMAASFSMRRDVYIIRSVRKAQLEESPTRTPHPWADSTSGTERNGQGAPRPEKPTSPTDGCKRVPRGPSDLFGRRTDRRRFRF